MTTAACPLGLEELVDYLVGESSEQDAAAVEDHLFTCAACAERLDSVDRVRAAVVAAVRAGAVGGGVDAAFVERLRRDGMTVHEYRIAEGATVACRSRPEDLVLVRLRADTAELHDLRVTATFEDLAHGVTTELPPREAVADRAAGEVMLLLPGAVVRAYPRSRWTLRLRGEGPQGPAERGPFVMDHTP